MTVKLLVSALRRTEAQALAEAVSIAPLVACVGAGIAAFSVWIVGGIAADSAAHAAAVASLEGARPETAAASAIPSWAGGAIHVRSGAQSVTVAVDAGASLRLGPLLGQARTLRWVGGAG